MMANNVYNPLIPYVGPIPGPLAPGFSILLRGSSHPSCNRFAVNLQCGPNISPRDDVALHIGVDFLRGVVIRNSIHNMNWGPEESQQGHFPLNRGAPFEIAILCESTHFNIAINGQHFASFEHRIVYHRASHISVDGEIIISSIEYNNAGRCSPMPGGLYPPTSHMPGYNPTSVPYPVSPTMHHQPYPAAPYGPTPVPGAQPYPSHLNSPYVGGHGQQKHGVVDGLLKKIGVGGGALATTAGLGYLGSSHAGGHGQQKHGVVNGLMQKIGAGGVATTGALAATAGLGYLGSKKAWKAQKKSRKKALKYGIPLAGAGLGAYAISRAFHSGSSSSSSSSSSDEE